MNTTPTDTPEAAPDYGEPWEPSCEMIFDRDGDYVAEFQPPFHDNSKITARAIACVNSMAGVPDPAAFVAEAKEMREAALRLRPIAEAGPVPEGAVRLVGFIDHTNHWTMDERVSAKDTHFIDIYPPQQ